MRSTPRPGCFDPDPLPPVHVQPKAGPRHFVFHPNYRFMYLLNEYDGSLYSYGYDARNGALSEIQVSSTMPPEFDKERIVRAADIHLTPDGKWLYASGRHPLTLAIFGVDAVTGRLTPAGHVPVAKEPRGFNIDPFGRYLLAAGLQTNTLTSYRIDSETRRAHQARGLPDRRRAELDRVRQAAVKPTSPMKVHLLENFRALFYTPFYATFELGAFEAEGVDVEMKASSGFGNSLAALAAGEAEVSWGGPMRVMLARDKDPGASEVAFCEVVGRDPFT